MRWSHGRAVSHAEQALGVGRNASIVLGMANESRLEQERRDHERLDPHGHTSSLADIILGGQDGLVNVLGVLLGVAAATDSTRIVLAAGMAATFAESVSMAAVAYTSRVAESERYRAESAREYRHIQRLPTWEREEVRALYTRKGFRGELLERIVDTITANKDVWVAVMLSEEHGLVPIDRGHTLRAAFVVGVSAIVGSFIPIVPFFFAPVRHAVWLSSVVAAAALFAFGVYKAKVTIGRPLRSGVELCLIGMLSAFVGYAIGLLFQ